MKEKKEKEQITTRIDTQLRDMVLKALEAGAFPEGTDFTDVIDWHAPRRRCSGL